MLVMMVFHRIKVMYLYLCRIAWLDRSTQICFVFCHFIAVLTMIADGKYFARSLCDDGISPSK